MPVQRKIDEMSTPVTFLYEDADLAIVDKPAGVAVIPVPGVPPAECLRDRVAAALGSRAWVVHRIDRDASGVVVLARTAEAHRVLSLAFDTGDVATRYAALVHGVPAPAAGTIDVALRDARRGKVRPALPDEPSARPAATDYAVTRSWRDGERCIAAVAATPHTAQHHQVRVHLRSIGRPILGDSLYGRAAAAALTGVPVPRLSLHAASIEVPHPAGGRRVAASAPWPGDLAALTTWLDAHWTTEATS
jgi:tRNA pseudouridine32 synthase / 23S rRNA pseudouridine746 synthase